MILNQAVEVEVQKASKKVSGKVGQQKGRLKSPIVASRKKYGAKIKAARASRGLTQCALAKLLKITQPALSNVERGAFKAGAAMQAKIKKTLGVTP